VKIDSPIIIGGYSTWISLGIQPTYTSSTSITFTGVDYTPYFPVGTKIKLTQTTVKYFYVLSVTYGTNTVLTLTAGSDYSVANAGITNFNYAHGSAYGFPTWFSWTPTITYTGGSFDPTSLTTTSKYKLDGSSCSFNIDGYLTRGTGDRAYIYFTLPINYVSNFAAACYTAVSYNAGVFAYGDSSNKIKLQLGTPPVMSNSGIVLISGSYII